MECLENNFYEQYVREPTRGGNILDLVITNELDLIGDLGVEAGLASSGKMEYICWFGKEGYDTIRYVKSFVSTPLQINIHCESAA